MWHVQGEEAVEDLWWECRGADDPEAVGVVNNEDHEPWRGAGPSSSSQPSAELNLDLEDVASPLDISMVLTYFLLNIYLYQCNLSIM
jgi:hypothetical protein